MNSAKYFKLSQKDKIIYVISPEFSNPSNIEVLVEIVDKEEDIIVLNKISERVINETRIPCNSIIRPFFNMIKVSNSVKSQYLWSLLINKAIRSNNEEDKILLVSEAKKEVDNPFLKAYITSIPSSHFLYELISDLADDGTNEILLIRNKAKNLVDLLENIVIFLSNVKGAQSLSKMFEDFKTDLEHPEDKKIINFLDNLLESSGISQRKPLTGLLDGSAKVEPQLFTSLSNYRNHLVHSFRVMLLGLQALIVQKRIANFNTTVYNRDMLPWIFASLFHDVGYGIQKLSELSNNIRDSFKPIGTLNDATFSFSETTRIFAGQIIQEMNNILQPYNIDPKEYAFHRLTPILKSWEEKKHGIISSILFLQVINEMMVNDNDFQKKFALHWARIFLKSALAMAVHTFQPELIRDYNVEEFGKNTKNTVKPLTIQEPILPAFLLMLFDTIEYLKRPRFGTFYGELKDIQINDIEMDIEIEYKYSLEQYLIVSITLNYDSEVDVLEIAKMIRKQLFGFRSSFWGIIIHVIANGSKRTIYLLKSEEHEFVGLLGRLNSSKDILTLYQQFISILSLSNGFIDEELPVWQPDRVSSQIEHYLDQSKKFNHLLI